MLNTDELKIIEIIQEHQTELFQKRTKYKNNQTELLAFSIEYVFTLSSSSNLR